MVESWRDDFHDTKKVNVLFWFLFLDYCYRSFQKFATFGFMVTITPSFYVGHPIMNFLALYGKEQIDIFELPL